MRCLVQPESLERLGKMIQIDGFQSRDKKAVLVHKTIANYGSCFA